MTDVELLTPQPMQEYTVLPELGIEPKPFGMRLRLKLEILKAIQFLPTEAF